MYDNSKSHLVAMLNDVDETTLIGAAIMRHLRDGFEIDPLLVSIREMAEDNPEVIIKIIGVEAARILNLL